MALKINHDAIAKAREAISAGRIDHGEWSAPVGSERKADECLAIDESAPPAEKYEYPVFKDGHISAKGLASASGYAEKNFPELHTAIAPLLAELARHKTSLSLSGGSQWNDLSLGDGKRVSVHLNSGAIGKEDAKQVPPGSTISQSGGPIGDMKFQVGQHQPHGHDNLVVPALKQTQGMSLANSRSPHLGDLTRYTQYASGMGFNPTTNIDAQPLQMSGNGAVATIIGSESEYVPLLSLDASKLPTTRNGKKCHYFWKESLPLGSYLDKDSRPFKVHAGRIETLLSNYTRARANGFEPPIPTSHDVKNSRNLGYIVDAKKNDRGSLELLHQFIGDEARDEAMTRKTSICTLANFVDEHGNVYSEFIDHNASVPNPRLNNLRDFQPALAASSGQPVETVELELAAPPGDSMPQILSTEHVGRIKKMIAKTDGDDAAKAVTIDNGIDKAISHGETLHKSTKLSNDELVAARKIVGNETLTVEDAPAFLLKTALALSSDLDGARNDAKAKGEQLLSLSADKREPDALSLSLITRSFKTDRDRVIESGVLSEAGMKEIDNLFFSDGKPTGVALSLSTGGTDPMYTRVCDILRRNPGVKTNNGLPRDSKPLPLSLSGDSEEQTIEKMALAAADATIKRTYYPAASGK